MGEDESFILRWDGLMWRSEVSNTQPCLRGDPLQGLHCGPNAINTGECGVKTRLPLVWPRPGACNKRMKSAWNWIWEREAIAPRGGLTPGTWKAQRSPTEASQVTVTNIACFSVETQSTLRQQRYSHIHLSGLQEKSSVLLCISSKDIVQLKYMLDRAWHLEASTRVTKMAWNKRITAKIV